MVTHRNLNLNFLEFSFIAGGFTWGTPNLPSTFLGLFGVISGLLLKIWLSGHRAPGILGEGHIAGPWRFVRHPEIVARFLIVFGFIFMTRTPWVFAFSVVVLGFQYRQVVLANDRKLATMMGPVYPVYRLFVPSILPHVLPVRLPQRTVQRVGSEHNLWSFRYLKMNLLGSSDYVAFALLGVAAAVMFFFQVGSMWMALVVALVMLAMFRQTVAQQIQLAIISLRDRLKTT